MVCPKHRRKIEYTYYQLIEAFCGSLVSRGRLVMKAGALQRAETVVLLLY